MDEIVKKLVSRVAKPGPGGIPGSLQPDQDRELRSSLRPKALKG